MTHFLSRLYKYRQSENRNQQENFLTEVFAHCLQIDKSFRQSFLKLAGIDVSPDEEFSCSTQMTHGDQGRPDVTIALPNDLILVECKVDAGEGEGQVEKYLEAMQRDARTRKYFIYLSKTGGPSITQHEAIKIVALHWHDIHECIIDVSSDLTTEFFNLLTDLGMNKREQLTAASSNFFQDVLKTVEAMDVLIDMVYNSLKEQYPGFKRDKNILACSWGLTHKFLSGDFWLGLYQYEGYDEVQVCVAADYIPKSFKKYEELAADLSDLQWDDYEEKPGFQTFYVKQPMSSFIVNGKFDYTAASNFLLSEFKKVAHWLELETTDNHADA
jgi:PD-(D/E)XK nuclease superfamily